MIREFTVHDYEAATELWKRSENIGLSSADDRDRIDDFLARNPGMSKVVVEDGQIIGTVLCSHDGRRGYLYHLCVDARYQKKGLGQRLVGSCLRDLEQQGIRKCHLFIFGRNNAGKDFWKSTGWQERVDIVVFSKEI